MSGTRSWIDFALGTIRSMWHFHMDLLTMWKDELSSLSMGLLLLGIPKDLSTYARMIEHYELVLRLFCFNTGYDPLVAIFDGEIRQNAILYEFFSENALYKKTSETYYNSKLEDINEQFTEQFIGNLCTLWGLIVPDIFLSIFASTPKQFFDSQANFYLNQKKSVFADSFDFFKWVFQVYSTALRNYQPFVTSAEIWRVWNPLIDLYMWTIAAHVLNLHAFKETLELARIKPFIETQRTAITLNGEPYGDARLIGNGEIELNIPRSEIKEGDNKLCFDTYGLKACMYDSTFYYWGWVDESHGFVRPPEYPSWEWIIRDMATPWSKTISTTGHWIEARIGYYFAPQGVYPLKVTIKISELTKHDLNACVYVGWPYLTFDVMECERINITGPGTYEFHIPYSWVSVINFFIYGPCVPGTSCSVTIESVTIERDLEYEGGYDSDWDNTWFLRWRELARYQPGTHLPAPTG